jgi:hypothetical protein
VTFTDYHDTIQARLKSANVPLLNEAELKEAYVNGETIDFVVNECIESDKTIKLIFGSIVSISNDPRTLGHKP